VRSSEPERVFPEFSPPTFARRSGGQSKGARSAKLRKEMQMLSQTPFAMLSLIVRLLYDKRFFFIAKAQATQRTAGKYKMLFGW